jgi:hypothetical protein
VRLFFVHRPSPATVVACLALFVALGGTSFAAATVIAGKDVKNGSLTGKDVKNSSLTGTDVKNKSLTPSDFNGSVQGPTGPQGPKGDTGPQGPKGDTGTVDTSSFFTKTESDGRFLAIAGKAADADTVVGLDSTDFLGASAIDSGHAFVPIFNQQDTIVDVSGNQMVGTCGTGAGVAYYRNVTGHPARVTTGAAPTEVPDDGQFILAEGGTFRSILQVAWGASLENMTTFTVSFNRPGDCPAEIFVQAVTSD